MTPRSGVVALAAVDRDGRHRSPTSALTSIVSAPPLPFTISPPLHGAPVGLAPLTSMALAGQLRAIVSLAPSLVTVSVRAAGDG